MTPVGAGGDKETTESITAQVAEWSRRRKFGVCIASNAPPSSSVLDSRSGLIFLLIVTVLAIAERVQHPSETVPQQSKGMCWNSFPGSSPYRGTADRPIPDHCRRNQQTPLHVCRTTTAVGRRAAATTTTTTLTGGRSSLSLDKSRTGIRSSPRGKKRRRCLRRRPGFPSWTRGCGPFCFGSAFR